MITNTCIPPQQAWGIGTYINYTDTNTLENIAFFLVCLSVFTVVVVIFDLALITNNPPDKAHPTNPFTWKAGLVVLALGVILILALKYALGGFMSLISKYIH